MHNQTADPRPPTRIERALGHERAASVVLLILLPLACWSWIVVTARMALLFVGGVMNLG